MTRFSYDTAKIQIDLCMNLGLARLINYLMNDRIFDENDQMVVLVPGTICRRVVQSLLFS